MRLAQVLAVVLCAAGSATSLAADVNEDVAAAYEAWDAAFNEGDAKGVASAYLPNAKLLPPTHTVVSGPAEIEEFFAGLFANGVTDHDLEIIDAGGDDKVVYSTANWTAKGKGADGAPRCSAASPRTCSNGRQTDR